MIPGFEDQTAPLTDYEKITLMPLIVVGLSKRKGVNNAITNAGICKALKSRGYTKVNSARIRKIINHIRLYDKLSCLVSSSKGYYVTKDQDILNTYIDSLNKRATAILAVARAIDKQRNNLNPNLFD
jgi:hypothetical protein